MKVEKILKLQVLRIERIWMYERMLILACDVSAWLNVKNF